MTRITPEKFKKACIGSGGTQSAVAQSLGVARQTVCEYLNRHPEMQQYLDEADKALDELAENKLAVAISNGDMTAIKFRLQNKTKYVPKQTIEHMGGLNNTIREVTPEELEEQFRKIDEKRKNASDKSKTD